MIHAVDQVEHQRVARDALRLLGVTKHLSRRRILESVDLAVPAGTVYGLVGDNGAGKTTTIRVIAGLMRPTSGTVTLFGEPRTANRRYPEIGVTIEEPRFYPWLSGLDNLRILVELVRPGIQPGALDAAGEQVGLAPDTLRRRVREYSQGMRQRLAVAAAIAHSPSLLVLDEPSNGLDPRGIRELHELLRRLADDGAAVLLSSHLLGELDRLCDTIGLMVGGRIIAERAVDDTGAVPKTEVTVLPGQAELAARAVRSAGADCSTDGDALVASGLPSHVVTRVVVDAGLDVVSVRPFRATLDAWFHEETARHAS